MWHGFSAALEREKKSYCVKCDYFGPEAIFPDRQLDLFFWSQECMQKGSFKYVEIQMTSSQRKKTLLMALKCLAYGILPSAFQDYFQISETSVQKCIKKVTAAVAKDPELRQAYLCPLNCIDARGVVQIHLQQHGVAGMIRSLDCKCI